MTWEVIPGNLHIKAITCIPLPGSYEMSKSKTSMRMFSHLGSTCCTTGEIQGHGLIRPRVDCLQNKYKTNAGYSFQFQSYVIQLNIILYKVCLYINLKVVCAHCFLKHVYSLHMYMFMIHLCVWWIKLLFYFILEKKKSILYVKFIQVLSIMWDQIIGTFV